MLKRQPWGDHGNDEGNDHDDADDYANDQAQQTMTTDHERGREAPAPSCSFCGKSKDQVRQLIQGPAAYICNECVELADDIIGEELSRARLPPLVKKDARLGSIAAAMAQVATRLEQNHATPALAAEARALAQDIALAAASESGTP